MVICIYWVIRDLLALDLLGALAYVGMFFFMGFLALAWLVGGEEILLDDQARGRVRARAFWGGLRGLSVRAVARDRVAKGEAEDVQLGDRSRGLTARSGDAT